MTAFYKYVYWKTEQFLPERAILYLTCKRRERYWKRFELTFIHVPKAAGTSISIVVYGRPLGHIPAQTISDFCPNTFANTSKFSIVRNPWERLVSAYRFSLSQNTQYAGVSNRLRYEISKYNSFEQFVKEYIDGIDVNKLDPIFKTQSYFLEVNGKIEDIDVFKIEKIAKVQLYLQSKLGYKIEIPKINSSNTNTHLLNEYSKSPNLINIVGDTYKTDIENFNFTV